MPRLWKYCASVEWGLFEWSPYRDVRTHIPHCAIDAIILHSALFLYKRVYMPIVYGIYTLFICFRCTL